MKPFSAHFWREELAVGVPVHIVREHDRDLLVGRRPVPGVPVHPLHLREAPEQVVGPLEHFVRIGAGALATEEVGLHGSVNGEARTSEGLALIGYGVHRVRGGGRHHEVDFGIVDQVAGHLRGSVRRRLAVLELDADGMILAVAAHEAVFNRLVPPLHAPSARDTEPRDRARDGIDKTYLNRAAGLDSGARARRRGSGSGRRSRGRRGSAGGSGRGLLFATGGQQTAQAGAGADGRTSHTRYLQEVAATDLLAAESLVVVLMLVFRRHMRSPVLSYRLLVHSNDRTAVDAPTTSVNHTSPVGWRRRARDHAPSSLALLAPMWAARPPIT
jgi:hypothetical protein